MIKINIHENVEEEIKMQMLFNVKYNCEGKTIVCPST